MFSETLLLNSSLKQHNLWAFFEGEETLSSKVRCLSPHFPSEDMDMVTKVHPLKTIPYIRRGGKISVKCHPCAIASKSRGDYANESYSSFWGLAIVYNVSAAEKVLSLESQFLNLLEIPQAFLLPSNLLDPKSMKTFMASYPTKFKVVINCC